MKALGKSVALIVGKVRSLFREAKRWEKEGYYKCCDEICLSAWSSSHHSLMRIWEAGSASIEYEAHLSFLLHRYNLFLVCLLVHWPPLGTTPLRLSFLTGIVEFELRKEGLSS